MTVNRTAVVTMALVAGVGIGSAIAPVAQGQTWTAEWSEPGRVVQLLTGGSYIGVSVRDVDAEAATRAKLPAAGGVLIDDVRVDSPAQKAGFKAGDIVVEFDGERVRGTRQFTRLVQETPAARQVQAVVVRDGQRTTLTVQPEAPDTFGYARELGRFGDTFRATPRPPTPPAAPTPPTPPARPAPMPLEVFPREVFPRIERFFASSGRLGLTVDTLSDQLADYFGAKEGVLVTSVTDNSAAAKAGLKAGDIVVSIDGTTVSSPSELSQRTHRLEDGDEFTLEIVRDKKRMTLKGKVEARQPRRWTAHVII